MSSEEVNLRLAHNFREFKFETDEAVAAAIEKGKGASSKPHQEAVKEFGMACGECVCLSVCPNTM